MVNVIIKNFINSITQSPEQLILQLHQSVILQLVTSKDCGITTTLSTKFDFMTKVQSKFAFIETEQEKFQSFVHSIWLETTIAY